jgi:predicted DNA-binding transcriptional regulator YafY
MRLRFSYVAKDERASQRHAEPSALVYSGHRWYLVAFDVDRDDWRTFRIDRIQGRIRLAERGRRRTVPGGDPAQFVKERLRSARGEEPDAPPARIRIQATGAQIRKRIPAAYARVEEDGESCIVSSLSGWSRQFLMWCALLDEPMEVLGPPELVTIASGLGARLTEAANGSAS